MEKQKGRKVIVEEKRSSIMIKLILRVHLGTFVRAIDDVMKER